MSARVFFAFFVVLMLGLYSKSLAQYRFIDSLYLVLKNQDLESVQRINTWLLLGDKYVKISADSAALFYEKALQEASATNDQSKEWESRFRIGKLMRDRSPADFKTSSVFLKEAVSIAESLDDEEKLAATWKELATLFWFEQDYGQMAEFAIKSLDTFKKFNDQPHTAEMLSLLVLGCLQTNDFEKGIKYGYEALDILLKLKDYKNVGTAYLNIASLHYRNQFIDSAMINYEKALMLLEKHLAPERVIAGALSGLGVCHFSKGEFSEAEVYFQRMLQINHKVGNNIGEMIAWSNLGRTSLGMKQYSLSIERFENALTIHNTKPLGISPEETLRNIYKGLSSAYFETGKYEKAQKAIRLYVEYKKKLQEKINANTVNEMVTRFERQKQMKELELTEKANEASRLQIWVLIGLGLVVIAGGNVIFLLYRRKKLRTALNIAQKNREILKDLFAIQKAEAVLQKELEYKRRELTSFSLHLIQKNEMLDLLRNEIDVIKNAGKQDTGKKLADILTQTEFSNHIDKNKDWENFMRHFEQVHKGFMEGLSMKYPSLNENDLRLCALLKLNFDTKQIASLLDITPDSAKVARYRLRKKLGLDTETSISDFLNTIEPHVSVEL